MKDQLNISDKSKISMPIANLVMVIALVASTVFGYSSLTNRITALETNDTLMESDLLKKADQTPKKLEIFMLIEELFSQVEKLEKNQEMNMSNKIKISY